MGMTPDFWRGRRVLLTGHTGFKGSWLSLWLQSLGAELTGFALPPPTSPSLFDEAGVDRGMRSIIGDIRDLAAVQSAVQLARPEVVIHMAAQPLVRYSYQNPVETYSTNVMGTVHLLEAVRQTAGVKAVVNVTTDKCYENREWAWGYRENEPMGGHDPYSNSKGCAELVTAAYRASFFNAANYEEHGIALGTARAGNVIGGGDWALDRLLPDILAAFGEARCVNIRNPHAIRPWQHVLEPLSGYLTLAERLFHGGPMFAEGWNFGPRDDDAKPVEWIVRRMTELWGPGAQWQLDPSAQPHEAHYLKLDISKAASRLGWLPVLRLDEALQLTVDWTRQRATGADVKSLTQNQIQQYQNRLAS
jgi:CDP-glucose 4,6-dehydratase